MNANSTFYRVVDSSRVCRNDAVRPGVRACPAHGHRIQKGVMGLSPATTATGKGTPDNVRQSGIRNRLHGASAPKPASGTSATAAGVQQAAERFSLINTTFFIAFMTQSPVSPGQHPDGASYRVPDNGNFPSLFHMEMCYAM
jgi:hypothetical protein